MRIGVNSGSLPKHLHALEREDPVAALVGAAVEYTSSSWERLDFEDFKVSIKSTSVPSTVASNRLLAERIGIPCTWGSPRRARVVGLAEVGRRAPALADGIGDVRISLSPTFHAEEEVKVAWEGAEERSSCASAARC